MSVVNIVNRILLTYVKHGSQGQHAKRKIYEKREISRNAQGKAPRKV